MQLTEIMNRLCCQNPLVKTAIFVSDVIKLGAHCYTGSLNDRLYILCYYINIHSISLLFLLIIISCGDSLLFRIFMCQLIERNHEKIAEYGDKQNHVVGKAHQKRHFQLGILEMKTTISAAYPDKLESNMPNKYIYPTSIKSVMKINWWELFKCQIESPVCWEGTVKTGPDITSLWSPFSGGISQLTSFAVGKPRFPMENKNGYQKNSNYLIYSYH